nr:MAG TPA: large terminase [Caudoviricetes sp.]DAV26423.1 MAG TPA: large terminase [Caudoviricetes sp.]
MGRIAKINDKFYDLGTGNKSFLQVASDLKRLGIKNWYFMLNIYDYSLINIDPHAVDKNGHTTLTRDQISRVLTECARNPWYYLREICRISTQGGSTVAYKANRGNIAQAYCILHGIDSWLCLPRRNVASFYSDIECKTSLIAGNSEVDNQQPRLTRVRFNDYRKYNIEEISI